MRAPKKVIAAMAMATLLGGTVVPAFADNTDETTGSVDGQPTKRIYTEITDTSVEKSESADITINGEFTKFVSSLPDFETNREGKYLCVTMPISLDYRYDVDSKTLYSPNNTIIKNESVSVTPVVGGKSVIKTQPVRMTFVGMSKIANNNMEYVKETSDSNSKVQLPFQLVVTSNGQFVRNVHLADLTDSDAVQQMKELEISAGNNIEFKIAPIGGKEVEHGDSLKGGEKVSTDLTLKFEYIGK